MRHEAQRNLLAACVAVACALLTVSCATVAPANVKLESGYYYGLGSGPSVAEAGAEAKRALISDALTQSARLTGHRGRIEIAAAAAQAFKLPKLKPFSQEKRSGSVTLVYRMKAAEWDKYEQAREAAIRTEIAQKLDALRAATAAPLGDRLQEAGALLVRLGDEGLTDVLGTDGSGPPLMSAAVEDFCREIADGLTITAAPTGGFVGGDTVFTAQVATRNGAAAGSLPLRAEWTAADSEPFAVTVSARGDGTVTLAYPSADSFRNRAVRLLIATDFARWAPGSAALQRLDQQTRAEVRYRHFDDAQSYFSAEALVPGGPFTAGAPARDTRATKKEAPREASTSNFFIDIHPITNALYGMFLDDTESERLPQYWSNPDYNQPDQPVIGVSLEEATRFASWLSAQLGVVKRLPTEDEWEKAARGGQDVIYPWGDQSPADGVRANYDGNGRFSATSPVGSFETGRNAYGILDMAGNVWEWTTTPSSGGVIVKGGSWMDGPTDLRVSNRRELDPSKGYVDVGFRLVREVQQ
jgi:hypothetical protein